MNNDQLFDFYINKMQTFKLRVTATRKEIIRCLLVHQKWHTIDDIVAHLTTSNNKKPNISSVYNVLHSFVKCGIVNAFLDTDTFKVCFNLKHDEHEHVYCFDKKLNRYHTLVFDQKIDREIKQYFDKHDLKLCDYYIVAATEAKNEKK